MSDDWLIAVASVVAFGKELTGVGALGICVTIGEGTIVLVGVTLGGGVGTDTDGVGGFDVFGAVTAAGFLTGAATNGGARCAGCAGIDA